MFANLYNNPVAKLAVPARCRCFGFHYMEHIEELLFSSYLVMLEQGDDKGRSYMRLYIRHDRPVCHHEVPRVFCAGSPGNRWLLIIRTDSWQRSVSRRAMPTSKTCSLATQMTTKMNSKGMINAVLLPTSFYRGGTFAK